MSLYPSIHICVLVVCSALYSSSYLARGKTEAGLVGDHWRSKCFSLIQLKVLTKITIGEILGFPQVGPKNKEH